MKYTLPKGYLSYSAMTLWKQNKVKYREKYYGNQEYDLDTPFTRFGKDIATTLEDKKKVKAHPVLSNVPLYSTPEYPLNFEVEGVPIKGYIDSFDKRWKKIIEIKTGIRTPSGAPTWDQVRVRKHDQVLLYSLGVKETLGNVHPIVKLIWIETCWKEQCKEVIFGNNTWTECGPGLDLTGHFEVFEREIREWEYDRMRSEIVKIASEISEDYSRYLQFSPDSYLHLPQ
jgi:hypothetical protein